MNDRPAVQVEICSAIKYFLNKIEQSKIFTNLYHKKKFKINLSKTRIPPSNRGTSFILHSICHLVIRTST